MIFSMVSSSELRVEPPEIERFHYPADGVSPRDKVLYQTDRGLSAARIETGLSCDCKDVFGLLEHPSLKTI
jgi:hypothetical protein